MITILFDYVRERTTFLENVMVDETALADVRVPDDHEFEIVSFLTNFAFD